MQLVLTEDQELLAKTAADFVRERSPVGRVRALRDAGDPLGYSREVWKEMAELGWVGVLIPESHGGAGMGLADLAVVLEALGRNLAPEPFVSTVLLGAGLIERAGSEAQKEAWLPKIAAGDCVVAVAYQETRSRYDLCRVATRAHPDGADFRLEGEKIQVLDGAGADLYIVVARTSGDERAREGLDAFLVAPDTPGLGVTPLTRIDHRGAATLGLAGVRVEAAARLGPPGQIASVLGETVDHATVGLCAEMLGGMSQVFADTLEHLKTRRQFGVPIGSFQGLKHRAARVFMEIELCRSAVMAAARAADEGSAEFASLVSLAKARCSDGYRLAANEGIQMFGGVGMTDEYDLGFYLKRACVADATFGDAAWHRDRWARLRGY